jgi:hypothetical protein
MRKAYAKIVCSSILFLIAILFSTRLIAEECYPLQLGVWSSAQIIPKEKAVCGLRFNPLYVDNERMQGLDIGVVNGADSLQGIEVGVLNWAPRSREKKSWGLQIGLLGNDGSKDLFAKMPDAAFTGVQIAGILNFSDISGIQIALLNSAHSVNGVQIGLWLFPPIPGNFAEDEVKGVQLSLTGNLTDLLYGVQVGLINGGGDIYGFQAGALNFAFGSKTKEQAGLLQGFQAGGFNYAKEVKGVQIGLLNICKRLQGVQIGVLNVVTSRFPDSGLFVFPLVNAGF